MGPKTATPARLIEYFACGWRVEPGDLTALVELLDGLAANPALVEAAGALARVAFEQHYDRHFGVQRILDLIGGVSSVLPVIPTPSQVSQNIDRSNPTNKEFAQRVVSQ